MAYHTLARSLEAAVAAPSASRLFATSVGHVLDGHVDNARHRGAGRAVGQQRRSESAMERVVADHVRLDLNPFMQCMQRAQSTLGALALHRNFNQRARLDIRTIVRIGAGGRVVVASRTAASPCDDPPACRDVHLLGMELVVSSISARAAHRTPEAVASVSGIAAMLGLRAGVAFEAALAFESGTDVGVADLAARLGCHRRTLQRQLKAAGLSAETLRRACMLLRATALLSGPMTLTEVAHAAGYADHAHMTRAFVTSCGLPPSILREALSPRP